MNYEKENNKRIKRLRDLLKLEEKSKKYHIKTYGCQMNEHDSEKIRYILEEIGYSETKNLEEADFILYNTCIVRENAELKVYGHVGALKHLKEKNQDLIIAICGCMMQVEHSRQTIIEKYPQVDIIFGTKSISTLPILLEKHLEDGRTAVDISEFDSINEQFNHIRDHKYIAYVNIMTGCNNFCTYCAVPYARGREDSRSPESILKEIKELANLGYKEITLLGQNVNSYGLDKENYPSFARLLEQVHEIDGIERIRFLTSHPKDISNELIEIMGKLPKVCKQIHLPFQSGSNRILKEMNRHYTKEKYLKIIDKIKKIDPRFVFSTDIMVGFPGETEEDFQETLDLVKKVEFEQAFTFIYSPREGTRAAEMEDQIPEKVVQDRFQRLLDEVYDIFYKKNKQYVGKIEDVLVEGVSKNDPDTMTGRSEGYKLVHFPGTEKDIGKVIPVKIEEFNSFVLVGSRI